jgi:hypothetical protein
MVKELGGNAVVFTSILEVQALPPHHVTESGCTPFIVIFCIIKIIINRETFAVFTITLTSFSLAFYKTFILK